MAFSGVIFFVPRLEVSVKIATANTVATVTMSNAGKYVSNIAKGLQNSGRDREKTGKSGPYV
jgi:hypothetical protein